jgi:2'-5' RNA ligase
MRLFVAILLDEAVRRALSRLQSAIAPACDGVRWIPADQLHLTVSFLGEVRDRDVPEVCEAVQRAALRPPFTIVANGAGCFPEKGPVRIVWAGARCDSQAMVQCVEAVTAELEQVGYPRERRPWSAHVTLGRVREDRSRGGIRTAVEAARLDPVQQPVNAVCVMCAVLSPKGPTYSVVSTSNLGRSETPQRPSR